MTKCLAKLSELKSDPYRTFLHRLNEIAVKCRLQEYTTYSRIWEYPWVWFQLEPLKGKHLRVVDIGSEMSPFPWFLATQGFDVIVSDMKANCWRVWQRASKHLGVTVRQRILNAQALDLPIASVDVYLSVSVIEHVPDKGGVILEAARVLRPGGLLVMTFDICEPDMDMTFPEWNGRALTMSDFDNLFRDSGWFEPGLWEIPWNVDDIPEYLSWHRTTALWHNYVTGAAVLRRNQQSWVEPAWKGTFRSIRGNAFTVYHLATRPFHLAAKAASQGAGKIFRKTISAAGRISSLLATHIVLLIGEPFFSQWGRRLRKAEIDLLQVERVLVVRLDGIGDVVLTTPFLRELRRNLPDAWITLVVKPAVYNLVERCPYVNEVLTYDWSGYKPLKRLQRHLRALQLAWKHLWRRHFDLAILPRWDADHYHGTYLMYFSGASRRVGYSENVNALKKRLNGGFDRLLTHSLQDGTLKHEVEHNLNVIRGLGGKVEDDRMELWVGEEDETFVEEILRNHGVKSGELLAGLGPGAGAPKREWPIDLYAEIGLWLQNECRARVVIIGGPEEESIGSALKRRLGSLAINAVGNTTLRQAAAFLKQAALFVGSDAGPMHIAAAMGVPVVELSCHPKSGSSSSANSPERFRPWGSGHEVIQPGTSLPPCTDECIADSPHCILGIRLEHVKQAVARFLLPRHGSLGDGKDRSSGQVEEL